MQIDDPILVLGGQLGIIDTEELLETTSTKRVLRGSGLSNCVYYRSIKVDSVEYFINDFLFIKNADELEDSHVMKLCQIKVNEARNTLLIGVWLYAKHNTLKAKSSFEIASNEIILHTFEDVIQPQSILRKAHIVSDLKELIDVGADYYCNRAWDRVSRRIIDNLSMTDVLSGIIPIRKSTTPIINLNTLPKKSKNSIINLSTSLKNSKTPVKETIIVTTPSKSKSSHKNESEIDNLLDNTQIKSKPLSPSSPQSKGGSTHDISKSLFGVALSKKRSLASDVNESILKTRVTSPINKRLKVESPKNSPNRSKLLKEKIDSPKNTPNRLKLLKEKIDSPKNTPNRLKLLKEKIDSPKNTPSRSRVKKLIEAEVVKSTRSKRFELSKESLKFSNNTPLVDEDFDSFEHDDFISQTDLGNDLYANNDAKSNIKFSASFDEGSDTTGYSENELYSIDDQQKSKLSSFETYGSSNASADSDYQSTESGDGGPKHLGMKDLDSTDQSDSNQSESEQAESGQSDLETDIIPIKKNIRRKSSIKKKSSKSKNPRKFLLMLIRIMALQLAERQFPLVLDKNDFERASTRLHVSNVPADLPCREDKFIELYSHLESALEDECGLCIYISGVPGTGKTATFMSVLRKLQLDYDLPPFQFVEINGMRLTEPKQAYAALWEGLEDECVSSSHAERLLTTRFTTSDPSRIPCIVLVDELDQLVTKKQSVVYNFFEWPNLPYSKLIVVAIANTMDLPERMLTNKVSSRLGNLCFNTGLNRITFESYKYPQLVEIVEARLEGLKVFDPDAIQLCARKVAQISGDARRCLDICRRAVEIHTGSNDGGLVLMKHVDKAIKEMTGSNIVKAVVHCSLHQRIFLLAIINANRKSGIVEVLFEHVADEHESICRLAGISIPYMSILYATCNFLGSYGIITTEKLMQGKPFQKIKLNIHEQDVIAGAVQSNHSKLNTVLGKYK